MLMRLSRSARGGRAIRLEDRIDEMDSGAGPGVSRCACAVRRDAQVRSGAGFGHHGALPRQLHRRHPVTREPNNGLCRTRGGRGERTGRAPKAPDFSSGSFGHRASAGWRHDRDRDGAGPSLGYRCAGEQTELPCRGPPLALRPTGNPGNRGTCNIKGNISRSSGRRIYHVPGDPDYASTRISPGHGERWFCTEAEARAAGWRRAGR